MRRLLPLLILAALAAPAAARQQAPAEGTEAPPPLRAASTMTVRSPAMCRADCAQDYYFCLGDNEADVCAPAWMRCRAGCGEG